MGVRRRQPVMPDPEPLACPIAHRRPSLVRMLWPVVLFGLLGGLSILTIARLSELEYEARRLERLSLEQDLRWAELMREHARLTSHATLSAYAEQAKLVEAGEPRPLRLGSLPGRQVHWRLPGEDSRETNGAMLGWRAPALDGPPL